MFPTNILILLMVTNLALGSILDLAPGSDLNTAPGSANKRTFSISFRKNTFIKDGEPYRYISGSMHYFRVPRQYWRERLEKMRVAGLTCVQTYVEWSSHQPNPEETIFKDNLDIEEFLQAAADTGLDVILRPGPYIDAERDLGGLPSWILKNKNINLRTNDPGFMKPVEAWYKILFKKINKYLYKNGGPIIMIQVENEYGSYGAQTGFCEKEYLENLRDLTRGLVGDDVVLFTTDGNSLDLVKCGKIDQVYATVDFGPGANVTQAFHVQRTIEPRGPLVNSEFYPGWLDHWGHQHSKVGSDEVDKTLDEMLRVEANVNIYMFHGGTSFGLSAGSNSDPFLVTPTSYDYDAPISESGDVGEKFWRIRTRIQSYQSVPPVPPTFRNESQKGDYGTIPMRYIWPVFNLFRKYGVHESPVSFEDLRQNNGFLLYETQVSGLFSDPAGLNIPGIRDRAYVYINSRFVGVLSRGENILSLPLQPRDGDLIRVLVENQGRICFGPDLRDRKGIIGNVTLGGKILKNWKISGLTFTEKTVQALEKLISENLRNGGTRRQVQDQDLNTSQGRMSVWAAMFQLQSNSISQEPLDTFVELPGWHKGIIIVNGFVLGRYWPAVGPQMTLYLPGTLLKPYPEWNRISILEQDRLTCLPYCNIRFRTSSNIDGPTPFQ
ncbi:beta-galactosidase isoform X3 [Eurytemora carolleeae]|uniref:beta-galactosidase isoform X3 n=1 Tax=Eurytemora carolleeae TaxID=1294199 RepID=UPI000C77E4CB|nr:beta-galactosidase isoform X3 [Eurytemora carolleeae]|eukprot:XP_023341954.1 beta-galactosidase-like isoform X3 [Eurytemora affinis]